MDRSSHPVSNESDRVRFAVLVAVIGLCVPLGGAAKPAGGTMGSPLAERELYQGKPIRWWAARAVINRREANQRHRDSDARGRTVRRLRRVLAVRAYRPVIEGVWLALASCESGRRWDYNGSSGFDGGLQFHPGTWSAYRLPGYPAFAYQASAEQQVTVARLVLAAQGWGAWPACARKLGLR